MKKSHDAIQHEWKADTSSDEIVGHFFAYTLYYDLVAQADEKPPIRAVVDRIMSHIIDHGYNLVDRVTGKPTTWGEWSSEFFTTPTPDPAPDRFRRAQIRELLPPDERRIHRWNTNVFSPDGGNGGLGEDDGAAFLLPYWMGRYHGFIEEK